MKKIYLSLLTLTMLSYMSFASCPTSENSCQKTEKENICTETSKSEKYQIDDDEYCIYNECYFDKQFKKLKQTLCLSKQQECNIDETYKHFKHDMEKLHTKYRLQKNKILNMIACDNDCYKDELGYLKDIKKDMKERCICFRNDVKEQLCKQQYSDFKKFQRQEWKKMKKIIKYGKIVKFPCEECCK